MPDEPLASFLYQDANDDNSTSFVSLVHFGLEFQFDPNSKEQTWRNLAAWFRANQSQTIGALPSPFFEDAITLMTMRAFGEDPAPAEEKKSLQYITDDAPDRE